MNDGPDYRQHEECLQEQWECVYCGKPVPEGIQREMNLCCGELHAGRVEEEFGNQVAEPVGMAEGT